MKLDVQENSNRRKARILSLIEELNSTLDLYYDPDTEHEVTTSRK
tara:strand:+ start:140 stop:274 length:135 start_codon:yes stop_codon:yes gene_type:complete